MDIHAPDHPILTLKDFAIHIAVVTVGILIALGLEGVREVVHDRHLVSESRENFRLELGGDVDHANHEIPITNEDGVVYVLTEVRKIFEHGHGLHQRFPTLDFYLNWALHIELERNRAAKDFLNAVMPVAARTIHSLSHKRPHGLCFCGTFSPSRRQMRSTRSLPTRQPARFSATP